MSDKGLCITCDNKKSCIFTKDLPVLECEEFSAAQADPRSSREKRIR